MRKIICALLALIVGAGCIAAWAEESVTIYIPPYVGQTMEQVRLAEEMGFFSAEKQPDGEIICTMSTQKYEELRERITQQTVILAEELKANLPQIESIDYAEDLSRFDVHLNTRELDMLDYLMTMTLSVSMGTAQSILTPDIRPESGVLTLFDLDGNILLRTKYEDGAIVSPDETAIP